MFIRFLSIIFYIYCSLAPQLLCITVRLSDGMFLLFAAIAISFSKKKTFAMFYGDQLVYLLVCLVGPHFGPQKAKIWNFLNMEFQFSVP